MAEASDIIGILRQNLSDAGCSEELTQECISLAKKNKWDSILPLLSKQRMHLLDSVHNGQRQIDCLDFLVYRINKKHIQEEQHNGSKVEFSERMG